MDLALSGNIGFEIRKILEGNFGVKKSFHSFAPSFTAADLETRNYILAEADKLFCQYGFKSVTMDDIAKHLGISKKTIYQHFADKNELVNILIEDKITSQNYSIQDCVRNSDNAVHEIFNAIQDMGVLLSAINPKLFYDLQKYHTEAWLNFKTFKSEKIRQAIVENLTRGIEEGFYRHDLKTDIITEMRLQQIDIMFGDQEQFTMNKYNMSHVMIEITEHFLYGICNKQGLALIEKYSNEVVA